MENICKHSKETQYIHDSKNPITFMGEKLKQLFPVQIMGFPFYILYFSHKN